MSGFAPNPELIQTLAVDHTTVSVIRGLQAEGVRPILLKGPSMARWLYPEGGRHYVDCDLLVSPREWDKTEVVLRRLGFTPMLAKARDTERERHSMPWEKQGHAVSVDLHHTLPGATGPDEKVWQVLSGNTETFAMGSLTCEVLNADARALHVALHAAEDGLGNPQVKEDLRRALQVGSPDTWERARRLAADVGAEMSFSAGLRLLPQGRDVADDLNLPDNPPAEVALRAAGHPATALGLSQVVAAGTPRRRLEMLISKIFPSVTFMRRWYPRAGRPSGLPVAYIQRWIWITRNAPSGYRAWRKTKGSKTRMKIVLYSWPFAPMVGGLERLTETVANQLTQAGQDVVVVTAARDPNHAAPDYPFTVERNLGFLGFYQVVRRSDVVLLFTFSLKLVLAALLARRPVVWQHIDFDTVSPRGLCHRKGYPCRGRWGECYGCLREDHSQKAAIRSLASLAAKRIAKSMVALNLISSQYAGTRMSLSHVEMVTFGIDTQEFSPPKQRDPAAPLRVFFCARHIPGKGCDVLLRALSRCQDAGMKFSAGIGGDGPHRKASMELADRLGLADNVAFSGHISDEQLLAELRAADVVAIPTLQDEIGQLVAYEAMSCQCCVVVSRIGAFPEQLEGAAEFFPPGDHAALADVLLDLSSDTGRRSRLGMAGRERIVESFEVNRMGQRYVEVLRQVAGTGA
jgi:glycosyltransferase involved in cell wall biosynthesis